MKNAPPIILGLLGIALGFGFINLLGKALAPEFPPVRFASGNGYLAPFESPNPWTESSGLARAVAHPVGDAGRGEALYAANCMACHQPGGEGRIGLAPSIRNRDFLALASDDFIHATIQQGRPGTAMVPRPDLSAQARSDLVAWLRALEIPIPVAYQVDPHRKIAGQAGAGSTKYAVFCASCHGPRGEGYASGGSGPGIGLSGFLDVASDDYIFKTVKHGRIGTAMRSFVGATGLANLEESDVGDIIAHLRSLGSTPVMAAAPAASTAPGDPGEGEALYAANCLACHQAGGVGRIGLAPSIRNRDFLALASDDFIRDTIHNGRPGTAMVPRPDLDGVKVNHLIAYLRALPVAIPLEVAVDPAKRYHGDAGAGQGKYTIYCASCHGPKGEGYVTGGSGPGIGLTGFLNVASDDFIFQTVKYGRVGTAMRPFLGAAGLANLNEQDVGDIIAHLRSLNP